MNNELLLHFECSGDKCTVLQLIDNKSFYITSLDLFVQNMYKQGRSKF